MLGLEDIVNEPSTDALPVESEEHRTSCQETAYTIVSAARRQQTPPPFLRWVVSLPERARHPGHVDARIRWFFQGRRLSGHQGMTGKLSSEILSGATRR